MPTCVYWEEYIKDEEFENVKANSILDEDNNREYYHKECYDREVKNERSNS